MISEKDVHCSAVTPSSWKSGLLPLDTITELCKQHEPSVQELVGALSATVAAGDLAVDKLLHRYLQVQQCFGLQDVPWNSVRAVFRKIFPDTDVDSIIEKHMQYSAPDTTTIRASTVLETSLREQSEEPANSGAFAISEPTKVHGQISLTCEGGLVGQSESALQPERRVEALDSSSKSVGGSCHKSKTGSRPRVASSDNLSKDVALSPVYQPSGGSITGTILRSNARNLSVTSGDTKTSRGNVNSQGQPLVVPSNSKNKHSVVSQSCSSLKQRSKHVTQLRDSPSMVAIEGRTHEEEEDPEAVQQKVSCDSFTAYGARNFSCMRFSPNSPVVVLEKCMLSEALASLPKPCTAPESSSAKLDKTAVDDVTSLSPSRQSLLTRRRSPRTKESPGAQHMSVPNTVVSTSPVQTMEAAQENPEDILKVRVLRSQNTAVRERASPLKRIQKRGEPFKSTERISSVREITTPTLLRKGTEGEVDCCVTRKKISTPTKTKSNRSPPTGSGITKAPPTPPQIEAPVRVVCEKPSEHALRRPCPGPRPLRSACSPLKSTDSAGLFRNTNLPPVIVAREKHAMANTVSRPLTYPTGPGANPWMKGTKRKFFTPLQEEALVEGVMKYGIGNWRWISDEGWFDGRCSRELSDKYRNLVKFHHLQAVRNRVKAKLSQGVSPMDELKAFNLSLENTRRVCVQSPKPRILPLQRTNPRQVSLGTSSRDLSTNVSDSSDEGDGVGTADAEEGRVTSSKPPSSDQVDQVSCSSPVSSRKEASAGVVYAAGTRNNSDRVDCCAADPEAEVDAVDVRASAIGKDREPAPSTSGSSARRRAVYSSSDSETDISSDDSWASKAQPTPKKCRRANRQFTPLEEQALVSGVLKFGKGNWKKILLEGWFSGTSVTQLSDKYRTMAQYGHVRKIEELIKDKVGKADDPLSRLKELNKAHWNQLT